MKKTGQDVSLLAVSGAGVEKEGYRTALVPETIPALFLLCGILCSFRDMMYGEFCLAGALVTGVLVILLLQISERSKRASRFVKTGLYLLGIVCFAGFLLYIAQGFLDTVNRILALWNLRFRTEFEQFSVDRRAAAGSLIFWCLCSLLLAAFLLMLLRKRSAGMLLALVVMAMFAGFVLGRARMWFSVLCLLAGTFGTLIFSAAPRRKYGLGSLFCALLCGACLLALIFAAGGYEGLRQITELREGMVTWFEKFRYGEDTLPKGDLKAAQGLLEGEEDTLKIHMDHPQELYLKGFVGGSYEGDAWRELSAASYQGEYQGLLEWLETKDFSAVSQYAGYDRLAEKAGGSEPERVEVQVLNRGAYRKFVYLPSSVEQWDSSGAKEKRDWQVRAGGFFGAEEYEFDAVDEAPMADQVQLAPWVSDPSGKEEEDYLGAESVYRSFAEEYYREVDDSLRALIKEMFFPEGQEMDFNDVTAQIRKVLRRETSYTEAPGALPPGQDFVGWFLEDSRRGNAVHYASAAVMAYRTAGYAARYVEGYHFSEEEALELSEKAETWTALTNKNAHAWAEVYFPGTGWLPVEVVPGMYTELYTNQVVEGAPAYQVNSHQEDDGLELEGGASGTEEEEEPYQRKELTLRQILSVVLLFAYVCLCLYLVLEIQRAARRRLRRLKQRRAGRDTAGQAFVDGYVRDMERLLVIGKVSGNYNHPSELSGEVEKKIEGVSSAEYERVVQLLQKVRFGGKELLPYEMHTLNSFMKKLQRILTEKKGMWVRIQMRYWYAMEN